MSIELHSSAFNRRLTKRMAGCQMQIICCDNDDEADDDNDNDNITLRGGVKVRENGLEVLPNGSAFQSST